LWRNFSDLTPIEASFIFFTAIPTLCDSQMNHWEMENAVQLGVTLKKQASKFPKCAVHVQAVLISQLEKWKISFGKG